MQSFSALEVYDFWDKIPSNRGTHISLWVVLKKLEEKGITYKRAREILQYLEFNGVVSVDDTYVKSSNTLFVRRDADEDLLEIFLGPRSKQAPSSMVLNALFSAIGTSYRGVEEIFSKASSVYEIAKELPANEDEKVELLDILVTQGRVEKHADMYRIVSDKTMTISRSKMTVRVIHNGKVIAAFKSKTDEQTKEKTTRVIRNNLPRNLTASPTFVYKNGRIAEVRLYSGVTMVVPKKSVVKIPVCPLSHGA